MQITLTQDANVQIQQMLAADSSAPPASLKLAYDSEGCGCSVDGVAALWLVAGPSDDDVAADGSPYHVLYDKKHEVFFDDVVTVDYSPARRAYMLKSKNQIYNSMMNLIDKRS